MLDVEKPILTDQVGEEQVVHLLSDPGHRQQAADDGGKVLWRAGGLHHLTRYQGTRAGISRRRQSAIELRNAPSGRV